MSDKVFLDTNVIVYAHDSGNPQKQAIAQELLRRGITSGSACVSSQVLGELFVVLTRKTANPLTAAEAVTVVQAIERLEIVEIGRLAVDLAFRLVMKNGISSWDALIVAAARLGECSILFTEDMQAGQTFDTVSVSNPFASGRQR